EHIHVIVLDPLPGREVVVDQGGTDTRYLVGAHRRADTAAADGDAAIDRRSRDFPAERDDKIRIVIARVRGMCAEIDDLMAACAKLRYQFRLQLEAAMIGGVADAHVGCSVSTWFRLSCRGTVGDHQCIVLSYPPGRNRFIAVAQ